MKCHAITRGFLALPLAKANFREPPQQPLTLITSDKVPQLGFGTWQLDDATEIVSAALQVGYEHIDCASVYGNEVEVGKGIQDGLYRTGKRREDIWVTSKLDNKDHGYNNVEAALHGTLSDLGLDYLDLYLVHFPIAERNGTNSFEFMDTWRGMERLVTLGKTRFIGIANFDLYQTAHIQLHAQIKPAVHQFEAHPYLQQGEFVKFNHALGIQVIAYSPLGNVNPYYDGRGGTIPSILRNKIIKRVARKRGCTSAQAVLAWGMKRGTSIITKSSHPKRIQENHDSKKCGLHDDDLDRIMQISSYIVKRFCNLSELFGLKLYQGLEDCDS